MFFNFFVLIIFAMGTVLSIKNAIHSESIGRILFWEFASGLDLIITILTAIQIFI